MRFVDLVQAVSVNARDFYSFNADCTMCIGQESIGDFNALKSMKIFRMILNRVVVNAIQLLSATDTVIYSNYVKLNYLRKESNEMIFALDDERKLIDNWQPKQMKDE